MLEIRGSEYQDFLRCRLRWKYRWLDGLVSKTPNSKLFFGTLFHKFLEIYYGTGDKKYAEARMYGEIPQEAVDRMDSVEYGELITTLQQVIDNYVSQYPDDFKRYVVVATELQFNIPLDDEVTFTGTIDLVLKDKETGDIYFMDHKTTSSIDKYEKNAIMDRQISRYWWALQQLGYNVKGFIYNIILKDYPVPPQELKKGGLSKNKAQKTTFGMYLKAIEDLELNIADYGEILEHLHDYPKEFFKRVDVFRNQAEIDASVKEFDKTASDILYVRSICEGDDTENNPDIYRNITQDCHWDCSFKDICVAGFDGSNVNYLLDALYTKEEK